MKPLISVLIFVLALAAVAQQPAPQQPPPPPPIQVPQQQESKITAEQAKELFRSVDEILQFVSKDTKFPIKKEIKRELASREQVQRYIEERIKEDKDAQRLQRSEVVLKKFGLLPQDFKLQAFLVELLREQVAGFYDAKKKTVYLLDWLPPEAQKPVLAHELTHALQDQNYNLQKWAKDSEQKSKDGRPDVDSDERLAARQAAMEGQAMVVLMDYVLAPTGQSVLDAPMIVEAMQAGMVEGGASPVFQRAPRYIREVLTFPYSYGLDFVRELLVKGGRPRAFEAVFQNAPENTLEIMDPARYLAGERVAPMRVPDLKAIIPADYERYDAGGVGAFDVSVMVKEFAPGKGQDGLWKQWRGGYYIALRKRGAKNNGGEPPPESLAVIYASRWGTPKAATEFAAVYAASVPKRYKGARKAPTAEPANPNAPLAQIGIDIVDRLRGPASWKTESGPVLIEPRGDMVMVVEGLDEAAAAKAMKEIESLGN